ncbi:MAG TPA: hypothetical protein VMT37_06015 [Solirubrobacterales bacterium]|nr:hypothetical protein [Solirubrobacterales bacterium]
MATAPLYSRRSVRALATALVLTLLAATAFAARAEALPARFWGAVPQSSLSTEQLNRLSRGGVESIRIPVEWGAIQPQQGGPISWADTDAIVERAAIAGVDVLPTVTGAPRWAVPLVNVPGGGGVKAPAHLPTSGAGLAGWKELLRQAVERYGPGGQFWTAHPLVPERPIRTWQIWNEPNFRYFVAKPNPKEYGQLMKVTYPVVRAADPGAQLILAGLFSQPKNSRHLEMVGRKAKLVNRTSRDYFASYFLEQMYKTNPGIKSRFSGVALHPYASSWHKLTGLIEEVRTVLARSGDAAKGLWLTELGWSSGTGNAFSKGPAGQARELKAAFKLLLQKQARWRVQRVYWFSVDDAVGVCNFCDGSGLFGNGFKPKKSWYEYVKFTGGQP